MNKAMVKLHLQLTGLVQAINAFKSASVQLKVTERVLDHLLRPEIIEEMQTPKATTRTPGPTRLINQLITTDYFNIPRSLPEITSYINEQTGNMFYTYQILGVLLGFFQKQKLSRTSSSRTNSYLYQLRLPIK